jgi:hypothetical protein
MIKDSKAEVTVAQKFNQGSFPKTCCISFSDGFLVTFFHKKVTDKNFKEMVKQKNIDY